MNPRDPHSSRPQRKGELRQKIFAQRGLILMSFPFAIYLIIFKYAPLSGWIMAFQDFKPQLPLYSQELVGFKHFIWLFTSKQFYLVLRNTFVMAFLTITFRTISAVTLALLLNEIRLRSFKRIVQTITYLPHFLSWVIIVSLLSSILHIEGALNDVLLRLGLIDDPVLWLQEGKYLWGIVTITNVWKDVGWESILYLSAIVAIDPQLYEAAAMDGADRFQRARFITLPGMRSTIVVLLIMNVGNAINIAGFELQLLIENGMIREYSETLEIFALHYGIHIRQYSIGAAASVFKSVFSVILLFSANKIASRLGEDKLV